MVSGCKSNGEYNKYGIREKEMNSLVTILKPEDKIPVIESNTSTSIRLHFINKDIAFEAYSNDGYFTNNNGLDLKIVGIIRPSEDSNISVTNGVGYTKQLAEYVISEINNSKIVKEQKENILTMCQSGSPQTLLRVKN